MPWLLLRRPHFRPDGRRRSRSTLAGVSVLLLVVLVVVVLVLSTRGEAGF
jgi:hypothetical protein